METQVRRKDLGLFHLVLDTSCQFLLLHNIQLHRHNTNLKQELDGILLLLLLLILYYGH